jgi:hypothetical protein
VSRRLVENIIISLLVGHKLKKCRIFAFNEDLAQLDGFDRVKNSFVDFGTWLGFVNKLNMLQESIAKLGNVVGTVVVKK